MTFSYDRAWNDMARMARAHSEFLAILTGLFMMVPDFVRNLFLPVPIIATFDDEGIKAVQAYFLDNSGWLFLINLPVLLGSATILNLLLDAKRPTVGQALATSFVMLPSVLALNLLTQFAIFGGFLMFIVPGLYLIGRLSVASAWQMAHRNMNPLTAFARSMAMTRGHGWAITGIVLLFVVVSAIVARAAGAVLGIILSFVIPAMSLGSVAAFLSAILSSLILFVLLLLAAAIYRQLAASNGI